MTRGRPKKNTTQIDDAVYVGLKMPNKMANDLRRDAKRNFRMRGQHILWILSDYVNSLQKSGDIKLVEENNKQIYTEQEMEDMYKQSKLKEGEK